MNDLAEDPDREILGPKVAFRADDPEQNLTDDELDRVLGFFKNSPKADDPLLRQSLKMQFQWFFVMARKEGFRERDGKLVKAAKPSTIAAKEMRLLGKACEALDERLDGLDTATKSWLDQFLERSRLKDENGQRLRLRHLKEQISWPIDTLIHAAHSAETITSPGPNNMALRVMIETLTECWEVVYGSPPKTDKGRGRQDDQFLKLCQVMASFADARMKEKGGRLGIRQLSGLVADVLENRRGQSASDPREK